jgi:hypothetical protein
MNDTHASISSFLQQLSQSTMVAEDGRGGMENHTKAGVVPFMRGVPRRFYMMRPASKIAGLGDAPFQICKGTRMHYSDQQGWHDIRKPADRLPQAETLLQTALREGIEEMGLKLANITRLIELGAYGFASVTTGRSKSMWLYAAEMIHEQDFLPADEIASSTAECRWFTLQDFVASGREDHRYILSDIDARLSLFYKE